MKIEDLKSDVKNLLAAFKLAKKMEMEGGQLLVLSSSIDRLIKFVESKEDEAVERPIIGEDARD